METQDLKTQDAREELEEEREHCAEDAAAEMFSKAFDHGSDFLGFLNQRGGFRRGENTGMKSDVELCAKFTSGAFGDGKKPPEFPVTLTLGTLGNVGRHRNAAPRHLIPQGVKLYRIN